MSEIQSLIGLVLANLCSHLSLENLDVSHARKTAGQLEEHGALAVRGQRLQVTSRAVINRSGVSTHKRKITTSFMSFSSSSTPVIPNQTRLIPPPAAAELHPLCSFSACLFGFYRQQLTKCTANIYRDFLRNTNIDASSRSLFSLRCNAMICRRRLAMAAYCRRRRSNKSIVWRSIEECNVIHTNCMPLLLPCANHAC